MSSVRINSEKHELKKRLRLANIARRDANYELALRYLQEVIVAAKDASVRYQAHKLRAQTYQEAAFVDVSSAMRYQAKDEDLFDQSSHFFLSRAQFSLSRKTQTMHYLSSGDWTYALDLGIARILEVGTTQSTYSLQQVLYEVQSIQVCLYCNNEQKQIVLKLQSEEQDTCSFQIEEVLMTKRAYPDADLTQYAVHSYKQPWDLALPYLVVTRMPFYPGRPFLEVLDALYDTSQAFKLILAVLLELQRIHNLGVLHGDIHSENILVHSVEASSNFQVRFIDFESAYCLSDSSLGGTDALWNADEDPYWAPERMGLNYAEAPPHTGQDIYSLGKMLLALKSKAYFTMPLEALCIAALDVDVTKRPFLDEFIQTVKNELATFESMTKSYQSSSSRVINRLSLKASATIPPLVSSMEGEAKVAIPLFSKQAKVETLTLPPISSSQLTKRNQP